MDKTKEKYFYLTMRSIEDIRKRARKEVQGLKDEERGEIFQEGFDKAIVDIRNNKIQVCGCSDPECTKYIKFSVQT